LFTINFKDYLIFQSWSIICSFIKWSFSKFNKSSH